MSVATIKNAIRSRFGTLVEDALSIPTAYDNAPFPQPSSEGSYCRVTINLGDGEQRDIGGGSVQQFRFVGIVVIRVHTQVDKGDGPANAILETIKNSFRAVRVSPGIIFRVPRVETQEVPDGSATWQNVVTCPFVVDENS